MLDATKALPTNRNSRARPVKHQWFDQWLVAKGEPLHLLVRQVAEQVERGGVRSRARKPTDQINHLRMVEGIVCNLAYAVLKPPPTGRLAVNSRNGVKGKSRYENRAFGKTFAKTLDQLAAEGLLDRKLPEAIRGEVSSIQPTGGFANRVRDAGITFADFAADARREVILLTRVKRRFLTETYRTITERELADYNDTPLTVRCRAEVRALNAFLADADISFEADGNDPPVDPFARTLTRRFNVFDDEQPHFDQVGRLFGGFWMSMKRERRKHIRINGEPVAELDFSSMFTRLAYARLRLRPPGGDLYAISGLEGHREGVKLAMNCFLFDQSPHRKSWPKDMGIGMWRGEGDDTVPAKLPKGWTVSKTKKSILAVHPGLDAAWGCGLGYSLMWTESVILIGILKHLMQQGIPALGLHDGLLVPVSKASAALDAMKAVSSTMTGIELPCSVKG